MLECILLYVLGLCLVVRQENRIFLKEEGNQPNLPKLKDSSGASFTEFSILWLPEYEGDLDGEHNSIQIYLYKG